MVTHRALEGNRSSGLGNKSKKIDKKMWLLCSYVVVDVVFSGNWKQEIHIIAWEEVNLCPT